jgi:hypothetical protein
MRPSDSPTFVPRPLWSSLAGEVPETARLFFAKSFRTRPAVRACCGRSARWRVVTGSPWHRSCSRKGQGLPGFWIVLATCAVVEHPAGCDVTCPMTVPPPWPSDSTGLGHPESAIFEAAVRRLVRSRAYASRRALPLAAQGSLPAGGGPPSPGGFHTRWTTNRISRSHRILLSFLTSLSWSHCGPDSVARPLGHRRRHAAPCGSLCRRR